MQAFKNRLCDQFAPRWSIGVYQGPTPFQTQAVDANPVLTAGDVTDIKADFVADPFIVRAYDRYFMFFEVKDVKYGKGRIGVAQSQDGIEWAYDRTVLKEDFHLSYPLVFYWDGVYYMIPETFEKQAVRLYKARDFPYEWEFVMNLIEGKPYVDATIFTHGEYWWLFTTCDDQNLELFYAPALLSTSWVKHPQSPVSTGRYARPGGCVLKYQDRLYRFSQDLTAEYGEKLFAHEILTLNEAQYEEQVAAEPFMKPTKINGTWNRDKMHHVDFINSQPERWLVITDGYSCEPERSFASLSKVVMKFIWKIVGVNQEGL